MIYGEETKLEIAELTQNMTLGESLFQQSARHHYIQSGRGKIGRALKGCLRIWLSSRWQEGRFEGWQRAHIHINAGLLPNIDHTMLD